MKQLLSPGDDVRAGELTPDEAAHIVDLVARLPDSEAFTTLHAYGPALASTASGLLQSDKSLDRVAGAKLTHHLRLRQHHPRLASLVVDPDARVRRAVVLAIKETGDDAQISALEPLTRDPELYIRLAAQRALADRGDRGLISSAREIVQVERRVARLRAYQALADVALPEDADWFGKELQTQTIDLSSREALWRGYATAQPEAAWRAAKKQHTRRKSPIDWHQYHAALRALAPLVPQEDLVRELDERLENAGKRVYGALAQALSRTRGDVAAARAETLLAQPRWDCEILVGRLSAEKEWGERLTRFRRALAEPGRADVATLQARVATLEEDINWMTPLAGAAWRAQRERLTSGQPFCRNLGDALTDARLDNLATWLADSSPVVRGRVAHLLGRAGNWRHIPALGAVYHDKSPDVRRKTRLAFRLILGTELRRPEGFLWKAWFVHTFGPLPTQHHPVGDIEETMRKDLTVSAAARPFGAIPNTSQDKRLQPKRAAPESGPATGRAPRK
jgi:HEAT repeat protein